MSVRPSSSERGVSLIGLVVWATVLLIFLTVAAPAWKFVSKREKEEELIFRGTQIAEAIARYQRKNGNTLPPSLDLLVKGRYLRKPYKDPMTKDGQWRLVRPGEPIGPPPNSGGAQPTPRPTPQSAFASAGATGPFIGVASRSTEAGLRLYNGRARYNEWIFVPMTLGHAGPGPGPMPPGQGPMPGPMPSPRIP